MKFPAKSPIRKKNAVFGLMSLASVALTGCDFATTSEPVTRDQISFVQEMITGQGYRCDEVMQAERQAMYDGYVVTCNATPKPGITITEYLYTVTKGSKGWLAVGLTSHAKM